MLQWFTKQAVGITKTSKKKDKSYRVSFKQKINIEGFGISLKIPTFN